MGASPWALALLLLAPVLPAPAMSRSAPPAGAARLASAGRALMPVVVGPRASAAVRATAATLAAYLGRITGTPFPVTTGDGSSGLVVGLPADFSRLPVKAAFTPGLFAREEYLLCSRGNGLWLLGATELAVRHAAWGLLDRLGYRQFFPGAAWEVVPHNAAPVVRIDVRESPDYCHRRIWYGMGFMDGNRETYQAWCARNRMGQGLFLESGHVYGRIIRENQADFDAHPEYYALLGGRRALDPESKLCLSNPGLRKLIVAWAIRRAASLDSISMEPSDLAGWCECPSCAAMGTPSDRALLLANEVARAINAAGYGEKFVGLYAYTTHGEPPTVQVDRHVIVSPTSDFLPGGLSLDQIIEGWKRHGANPIGIYHYFSIIERDWNLPGRAWAARYEELPNAIRHHYRQGARFYDCEAGDCWGPCGLGYYLAARAMWDVTAADRVDALVDDFLSRAFGPAKAPMRDYYRLIGTDDLPHSPQDMVGRMYRHLATARRLAASRPDVLARLDELILYTRFAELGYASRATPGDAVARDRWLAFAYRIRTTSMVHTRGLWESLLGPTGLDTPAHPLKDETPVREGDTAALLAEGIARNPVVEPGFTPVRFSRNLVPAGRLHLPDSDPGTMPGEPQDLQNYYLWVGRAPAAIPLKVTVLLRWNYRPHHIKLYRQYGTNSDEELVEDITAVKPDGKTYDVTLHPPTAGLYRVEVLDGGDITRIAWPEEAQPTLPSGIDTPSATTHFRGEWTLYFYVPKGTTVIGGWAARIAAWTPPLSGVLRDADGRERLNFAGRADGWFAAPVPPGQDGRLWKFEHSLGVRQLLTVPPYLACRGNDLLLPREVVEKDAAPGH